MAQRLTLLACVALLLSQALAQNRKYALHVLLLSNFFLYSKSVLIVLTLS